jgi:hypothetical protein
MTETQQRSPPSSVGYHSRGGGLHPQLREPALGKIIHGAIRTSPSRPAALLLRPKLPHVPKMASSVSGFNRRVRYLPTNAKDRRMGFYFTFALYHGLSQFNEKARESMSIGLRIISEMKRIASEQQITLPPLDDDLSLHQTSFSLTIGDFIKAHENVPA